MSAQTQVFLPGGHTRTCTTTPPLMDLVETDAGLELYCDLPGASRDGIDITLHGGELSLRATAVIGSFRGKVHAFEICDTVYAARISLGTPVDATRVTATFSRGVLRVTLPFPEKAGPVKIPVASGQKPQGAP